MASRNLKVNFVYVTTDLSGGAKSNRLIAEALAARGHDVKIFLPRKPRIDYTDPKELARWAVRKWRNRGKQPDHLVQSRVPVIPVDKLKIEAADVPDADVTIATTARTRFWINDWPASKGIKAHFIRGDERKHVHDYDEVEAAHRLPGLQLVISNHCVRLMEQVYGVHDSVLVPNAVDWSQFQASPHGKQPVPTVGLMYSRVWWKYSQTALLAAKFAQKVIPNLRVIAFGSAPPKISETKPKNFTFTLRPDQKDIPKIYQSADAWLLSSIEEGFGMPGIEAAGCYCPVIATRCGGPEDYVSDGESGYLVKIGDSVEMGKRIIDIVNLPDATWREMSLKSRQMAERFSWDRSAELLERAIYQRLGWG